MKKLSGVLGLDADKGTSVLVHGPGVGKTLCVRLILENLGFPAMEIVHVDAALLKINHEDTGKIRLKLWKTLLSSGFNSSGSGRRSRIALVIDNVVGSHPNQERHTTLLTVLGGLLRDHPRQYSHLVVIADERATPAIRNLPVTVTVPFYKPTQEQLMKLTTHTNQGHKLGLLSEQIHIVARESTDFRQLLLNMHLMKLNPVGSLTTLDGTGETGESNTKTK